MSCDGPAISTWLYVVVTCIAATQFRVPLLLKGLHALICGEHSKDAAEEYNLGQVI